MASPMISSCLSTADWSNASSENSVKVLAEVNWRSNSAALEMSYKYFLDSGRIQQRASFSNLFQEIGVLDNGRHYEVNGPLEQFLQRFL